MPARLLLTVLLLPGLALPSADADRRLIERLEASATAREQHDILDGIVRRLADGPMSPALTDRLVTELMSEESYGYHRIMRELPRLAGERGFTDQSLISLARGLSGELTRHYDAAAGIAAALSAVHAGAGLPEAAFAELIAALDHVAMLNRSAAIDVLAATRRDDARYGTALSAVVRTLRDNPHEHTRSSAIGGLARLVVGEPLPAEVGTALVEAASGDPYMTVRMNALELLASRDPDDALRSTLSASLAAEIVMPTAELWERSRGLREHDTLGARATAVLLALHEAPYPRHVVDAWIVQAAERNPSKSLEALQAVHERGELTAEQTARLLRIAEGHRMPADREMIYAMLFAETQPGELADVLAAFEAAADESQRLRAGYALKAQYGSGEVPPGVADVATRVVLTGGSEELRSVAAGLVARSRHDRNERERRLMAALEEHPDDGGIQRSIISLFGTDRMEDLIVAYASREDLSVTFRRRIVHELGQQAKSGVELSVAAENTLKEIARLSDDYYLVQNAGKTLQAWGVRAPLRVALTNRANRSIALFVVLVTLVVVNAVAAVIALVAIFKLPLPTQAAGRRTAIRAGMLAAWALLTFGMLLLLAGGAVGFLGHNAAPSPRATLLWNTPAYAGTVVYVFLVRLLARRARAARGRI